ncbi:hypothetical protein KAR91_49960 [Candidatus Pacearchaeota archaeon]|nr:hypothetical protein [Candidatus Pacearchaeota archaeon]
MAQGFTGETFITYSNPKPFTTPTENIRAMVRSSPPTDDIIQRQFIEFSSRYIEEIMFEISAEYRVRELGEPNWYIYVTETESDRVAFTPQIDGRTLKDFAIKFYPLYVRDIQSAIEVLVADGKRPDSLGGHFARTFANGQGIPGQRKWNSETKLQDGIRVPGAGIDGFITINPLSRALGGQWPFLPEDIVNVIQKIGTTMDGRTQHNITIDDPNYPQFLVGVPSGNPGSRDPNIPQEGRDTPMTPIGRPPRDTRITKNQLGVSQSDLDQGYSYLSALGLSLHQLRYQPPQIETFPENITPIWYTTNLVSNLTPNLAWVLAQPVEQAPPILSNWGSWFFLGFCGVQNNRLIIKTAGNPQEPSACQTECPYSAFFPPSTCQCTCSCGVESSATWWSSEYFTLAGGTFMVDELFPTQISPIRSKAKIFNRNTILRIHGVGGGTEFKVGVKTAKLGVIDIPYVNIVDTSKGVGSQLPIELNLMEAIESASVNLFGGSIYEVGSVDALVDLRISTKTESFATSECPAEFGDGGRGCPNCLGSPCTFGASNVSIDYIFIGEDSLAGDPVLDYL